jgi:hypothetical protein
MTRFGEFSPIVRLFTLGSFLKLKEAAQIFGLLFSHGEKYVCNNFDKNGLGYMLGDFLTNSSGHPDKDSLDQFYICQLD